jgi:hypothetical protein
MTYKAITKFDIDGVTYQPNDTFTIPAGWKTESIEVDRSKTGLAISRIFYNQSGSVCNTIIEPIATT